MVKRETYQKVGAVAKKYRILTNGGDLEEE
jgi:hypothetical protein